MALSRGSPQPGTSPARWTPQAPIRTLTDAELLALREHAGEIACDPHASGPGMLGAFLDHELHEGLRDGLLRAIATLGDGERVFTTNTHDLRIDGSSATVTVADTLALGREEQVDLATFVRALRGWRA